MTKYAIEQIRQYQEESYIIYLYDNNEFFLLNNINKNDIWYICITTIIIPRNKQNEIVIDHDPLAKTQ